MTMRFWKMSSRGKCGTQIITQQLAANHDFPLIFGIHVCGAFVFSEGRCFQAPKTFPTSRTGSTFCFLAVCLINKLF